MAAESPMWTLFVKKGDDNTTSVIERREVFMVSRACIDKPSNCSFLRSCHYICHPSKPNQELMAFSLIIREIDRIFQQWLISKRMTLDKTFQIYQPLPIAVMCKLRVTMIIRGIVL